MRIALNEKQIEGLASFLFDIAKGLLLGTIGSMAISDTQFFIVAVGSLSATFCVVGALRLLDRL
ncbi:MAG: hypothetical protein AAB535_03205 [Patescibacteria group bacterium]